MDSAASSIELVFHSCFELSNRRFCACQQKKRFYAQFFYESHIEVLFNLTAPLVKLFLAGSCNILHKSSCGTISLQILWVPSKYSAILFYITLLLSITERLSPKKHPAGYPLGHSSGLNLFQAIGLKARKLKKIPPTSAGILQAHNM